MTNDIKDLKLIDEDDNEYIIGALTEYNSEKYALMVNINDEQDNFIGKIIKNGENYEIEVEEDEEILLHVVDGLKTV